MSSGSAEHTYLTMRANPVDCSLVICCKKIIGLKQKLGLSATPPDSNIYWEVLPILNISPLVPQLYLHSWSKRGFFSLVFYEAMQRRGHPPFFFFFPCCWAGSFSSSIASRFTSMCFCHHNPSSMSRLICFPSQDSRRPFFPLHFSSSFFFWFY